MNEFDELVRGSIDMHVHFGPDPFRERRHDIVQLALAAREAGMAGLVPKCHYYPAAPVIYAASQAVPGIELFGSLALNNEVGGVNPYAVEVAGRLGARMVWLPTFSAQHDMVKGNRAGKGISLLDERGQLVPQVNEVLEVIRQYDMIIGTGHISRQEIFAVLEAARAAKVERIIITHAMAINVGATLSVEDQLETLKYGAFIEHCVLNTMPTGDRISPRAIAEAIRTVGPERCILSTDFGQAHNPSPAEGMRLFAGAMLQCGLSRAQVELMMKTNPAQLLGVQ